MQAPRVDISVLLVAIETGATLREACREAGIKYRLAESWMEHGRTSGPGTISRANREAILKAQSTFATHARYIVTQAAIKGAPRAVDEVLRRVEVHEVESAKETPPTDPIERKKWRLRDIEGWIREAGDIARVNLLRAERELIAEINALETAAQPERILTRDESLALLAEDLPAWSDAELLLVHGEGLRRGIMGFSAR